MQKVIYKDKSLNRNKGINNPMYGKTSKNKGKKLGTYEEIYGEKRGKELRELRQKQTNGKNNPMYGKHHSEKTKKKISSTIIGHSTWNKGLKKDNDERIRKFADKLRGRGFTIEHKRNISKQKIKMYLNHPEVIKKIKEKRALQILPIKDTRIEVKIQSSLNKLNIPFISHKRIGNIAHAYNCDLFIPSMNLVIECDGNHWHNYPYGREIDIIRNKEMLAKGYHVLRLWENEIKVMELNDLKNKLGI